jgi:hypothetical protein
MPDVAQQDLANSFIQSLQLHPSAFDLLNSFFTAFEFKTEYYKDRALALDTRFIAISKMFENDDNIDERKFLTKNYITFFLSTKYFLYTATTFPEQIYQLAMTRYIFDNLDGIPFNKIPSIIVKQFYKGLIKFMEIMGVQASNLKCLHKMIRACNDTSTPLEIRQEIHMHVINEKFIGKIFRCTFYEDFENIYLDLIKELFILGLNEPDTIYIDMCVKRIEEIIFRLLLPVDHINRGGFAMSIDHSDKIIAVVSEITQMVNDNNEKIMIFNNIGLWKLIMKDYLSLRKETASLSLTLISTYKELAGNNKAILDKCPLFSETFKEELQLEFGKLSIDRVNAERNMLEDKRATRYRDKFTYLREFVDLVKSQ